MDQKIEAKLVEKYPNLYSKYGGDIRDTCMGWGMSCGNGWFKLLDELSAKLESLNVIASQVKEKFGGLRFYIESCSDEIYNKADNYITEAENKSYEVCEICGKEGELRHGGWLQTTCDTCQKLYEEGKSIHTHPEEFESAINE